MARTKRLRDEPKPAFTVILDDPEANETFLNSGDVPMATDPSQYQWGCGVCKSANDSDHLSQCTEEQRNALGIEVEERRTEFRTAKMRRLGLSTAGKIRAILSCF
jgi:hypothetical protein